MSVLPTPESIDSVVTGLAKFWQKRVAKFAQHFDAKSHYKLKGFNFNFYANKIFLNAILLLLARIADLPLVAGISGLLFAYSVLHSGCNLR